jgi:DNA-binding transcriptional LysR family regulator
MTDSTCAKELALAGAGIAYILDPLVRDELREGRLRQVLPQTAIEEPGLFLYYPRRPSMAPRLRAFIEVAREALGSARA